MMSSVYSMEFSVDLIEASKRHLDFLQSVDKTPGLFSDKDVQHAIRRYENCWLPLAAKHSGKTLVPPLDVHWIWHCHMLAPFEYERDCLRLVKKTVDHALLSECQSMAAIIETKELWEQEYENEPFKLDFKRGIDAICEHASKSKYNLKSAVSHQRNFLYQVSLPHYRDVKFLTQGLNRYRKFIQLKERHRTDYLVPCYDIDLIWHTHQLFPLIYKKDTSSVLGRMLNHDDSVSDRKSGSKLVQAYSFTRDLWEATYHESYEVPGSMYRGESPVDRLKTLSTRELFRLFSKKAKVTVNKIRIENFNISRTFLQISLCDKQNNEEEILNVKIKPKSDGSLGNTSVTFHFSTKEYRQLQFSISQQQSSATRSKAHDHKENHRSSYLGCQLENMMDNSGFETNLRLNLGDEPEDPVLNCSIKVHDGPIIGPCILLLQRGPYYPVTMPKDMQQLWGPMPYTTLPEGMPSTCIIATHRFHSPYGQERLSCQVLHSIPILMSGVKVFSCQGHLAAFSHLLYTDQLPTEDSVETALLPTLSPRTGSRAMLIKDSLGDWGLLIGRWCGLKKGTSENTTTDDTEGRGSPGHLHLRLHHLRLQRWETRRAFVSKESSDVLTIGDVTMFFRSGSLVIQAGCPNLAQSVCLAMSVAVLSTLCQPRPVQLVNIATVHTHALPIRRCHCCLTRESNGAKPLAGDHMDLLLAAGYLNQTPCNSFIWSYGQCRGAYCDCEACGSGGGCQACRDCSTCSSCCGY